MKKTIKMVSTIVILLTVIFSLSTVVLAATTDIQTNFIDAGNVNVEKIKSIGANIATIIRNVGIVLAVIILMVLGIKYMMGSAQEKAEYKKTMIPYIVGAFLLFGAAAIAQVVISLSGNLLGQ